jgi:hypothetical protein
VNGKTETGHPGQTSRLNVIIIVIIIIINQREREEGEDPE